MARPQLTFFCELETDALQALVADPAVIEDLAALGAGVSLGILDLSAGRADAVRRLNQAGVPVVAWLLLPKEQGYWFNLNNAPQAIARYGDFKAWTAQNRLRWAGVGVDIEFDMREVQALIADRRQALPLLLRHALDGERVRRAKTLYDSLIAQIRADGYRVDSYHIPFIVDERKAGATLLQRLAGVIDVKADREVLMLYSSFLRPYGHSVLWSYAPEAGSIGVGSTGGGVTLGGADQIPPLNWDEFARDLRLALHWTADIHVFSLEGCVRQGFLKALKEFDWDQPAAPPLDQAAQVDRIRAGLRAALWASAHPFWVLGALAGVLWMFARVRRRK